jgi:hypothetical protein
VRRALPALPAAAELRRETHGNSVPALFP